MKTKIVGLLFLLLACSANRTAMRELIALKVESSNLDAAFAGAYSTKARLTLARATSLGDYHAMMDAFNKTSAEISKIMQAINLEAHEAGIKILNEDSGDHLVAIKSLVCRLGVLVQSHGIQIHASGNFTMRCSP